MDAGGKTWHLFIPLSLSSTVPANLSSVLFQLPVLESVSPIPHLLLLVNL